MKIVLNDAQWVELNVDKEREFVRCACFLGMNYLYIQNRCRDPSHESERKSVIATAHDLGILPADNVVKGIPRANRL